MPIPKPGQTEDRATYIERCMGDATMNREYPDNAQRMAICSTQWRNKDTQASVVWVAGLSLADEKKWYLVIPKGSFKHPMHGDLNFDDQFIAELKQNYDTKVLGETRPFVDVNHDQGEAMGWINELNIREDGLYALIEWTEKGAGLIKAGSFKFFSPWIGPYTNPQTGETFKRVLRGGALTNVPFLKMLPPMELKEAGVTCDIKLSELEDKMDILEALKKALGLTEDVKEEDVLKKITELQASEKELTEKMATLDDEHKKAITELTAKVEELSKKEVKEDKGGGSEELKEINTKLTEALDSNKGLAVELHLIRKEKYISLALSEGRLKPSDKEDWEKLFDENEDFTVKALKKLPVVISLKEQGHSRTSTKAITLTDDDKEMAKMLDMTLEDYEKYLNAKLT